MATVTAAPTALGVSKEHITKTPNVCGGKACIAGTRIRVMDIVALRYHLGKPVEDIPGIYPSITLSDVYAALAYYLDHTAEIEAEFERDRKMDEFGETQPSLLKDALARHPELRARLERAGE